MDLRTGSIRILDAQNFKGKGGKVPGGAATVLDLPLDPAKELKSLTVRALANEVVIGLMSVTLRADDGFTFFDEPAHNISRRGWPCLCHFWRP